jgi:hypothetical protein
MIKVHIRNPSMDQHALSKLPQRLPGSFCKMAPLLMFRGANETATLFSAQNCSNSCEVNSVPASLLIFSISEKVNPLINLCSASKVVNAAMTDCEFLVGIPMILVNLEKASTKISKAEKWLLGVRLSAETGGSIST